MKSKTIQFLVYCSLTAFAGAALASGSHSGGHGQGAEKEIGRPGVNSQIDRTVNIDMNDEMRFVPDTITVKQGETIRFLVKNIDEIEHEFVLGTEKDLMEHYEMMKKFPEMEHEDPNLVRVAPGQVGEVVWQFTNSGKIDFGCLIPGHYSAGMKGAVQVSSAKSADRKKPSEPHSAHKH